MKLSKWLLILALGVGLNLYSMGAFAQDAGDIVGVWMPSEGTSYIKIFKEKGKDKYHGKVVWLKVPNDDQGNPRKDAKGTPIMNMLNLKNFEFKNSKWTDGTIYDPKSGNTYYCTIEMINKDKIEVRGSIDSYGLVGRTDTWVRMKNTPSN
jgi:uncharacterized protein (DUF2147 family)